MLDIDKLFDLWFVCERKCNARKPIQVLLRKHYACKVVNHHSPTGGRAGGEGGALYAGLELLVSLGSLAAQ